mmetsp:Transcript_2122/g.5881  ORF Transcript_2122/g.5881 Transcript_2122/m.5881 type:complete len:213 (+) Transcript_2122:1592-2230(+)
MNQSNELERASLLLLRHQFLCSQELRAFLLGRRHPLCNRFGNQRRHFIMRTVSRLQRVNRDASSKLAQIFAPCLGVIQRIQHALRHQHRPLKRRLQRPLAALHQQLIVRTRRWQLGARNHDIDGTGIQRISQDVLAQDRIDGRRIGGIQIDADGLDAWAQVGQDGVAQQSCQWRWAQRIQLTGNRLLRRRDLRRSRFGLVLNDAGRIHEDHT